MRTFLVALILLALPATAQELSDRYQVIGEMAVTLDGTDMILPIAVDLENKSSFAEIRPAYGSVRMLSVAGVTATDEGGWDAPVISLVISISGAGGGSLMAIDLVEKGRGNKKPTVADMEFGSMDLPDFSITEDGAVDFRFSGELIRTVLDDSFVQTPEDGQSPVAISGKVSVVIPEAYRVQ